MKMALSDKSKSYPSFSKKFISFFNWFFACI